MPDDQRPPVLNRNAVAAMLDLAPKTISNLLDESKPGRRYSTMPFPAPDGYLGKSPYWRVEREGEIRAWGAARPGRGAGGGRPKRTTD